MHGAVSDGWEATYFSTDGLGADIGQQMNSIGLDLPSDADQDRLSVRPIHKASPREDAGAPIDESAAEIESLLQICRLVVVDDITRTAMLS